jgi:hypothetical protein
LVIFASSCKPPEYSINIDIQPIGGGSVDLLPGDGSYLDGTEVTLTPIPAWSFVFVSWSGKDASYVNDNQVVMFKDMDITANFQKVTPKIGTWVGTYPSVGNSEVIIFNLNSSKITTSGTNLYAPGTSDKICMAYIVFKSNSYMTFYVYDDIPIINNSFSYVSDYVEFKTTIQGTFTSSTTCEGNVKYTQGQVSVEHAFVAHFEQ